MDKNKKMLLIDGEPNDDVISCYYDRNIQRQIVTFSNRKSYHYGYNRIEWIEHPSILNVEEYKFTRTDGFIFYNIIKVLEFKRFNRVYLRFFFKDGTNRSYNKSDLKIELNALHSEKVKSLFDYYKQVSEITGLKGDNEKNTLTSKYEKITFISKETALSKYLNAQAGTKNKNINTVLFPFGGNLSQITAVRNALENQMSIIEGPPGTGKTQTILNIIANLVAKGNTVAIVSNNNDATNNVYEKLKKHGYDYIAAELGSGKNKDQFINEKQIDYPDFTDDTIENVDGMLNSISALEKDLVEMLESKNRVAILKQELSSLIVEKQYFDDYFNLSFEHKIIFKNENKLPSKKILELWNECQQIAEHGNSINFFTKLKYFFKYKVNSFSVFKDSVMDVIPQFKRLFYTLKQSEMEKEISDLESKLSGYGFDEKMIELSEMSNKVFKHSLAQKYGKRTRKIFTTDDLWKDSKSVIAEYPVILSSTYSAISSLSGIVYDYVIVDEASQVDLSTGVLAMACAKNIVVVGDLKQLPNVSTDEAKKLITSVSCSNSIQNKYRQETQSLLSSVCAVFEKAPRTLLREHYRCHPKIIGFCNQKFYNNQLIIMTEDNNETDVLKVYVTSQGNHARGHHNQRQIDETIGTIIPELKSSDYGIISPYRAQTIAMTEQIDGNIPISTVHKFQGRENNDIIISTVDNEITKFTDNPNMLNVAVSRAKNRLRLIISDNEENKNTNIGDLVKYIEYNNFEIKKSEIFSVFDMLYKSFETVRKEYLSKRKKVSEYDSENLMYALIEDVLSEESFSKLSVIVHQPLNTIIRDLYKLDEDEVKFTMNSWTHVDFLIYNKIDKSIVLAVEVDGYEFHKDGTTQRNRDVMKDGILEKYEIPLIRFNTTGSSEREKLKTKLNKIFGIG